MLTAKTPLNIRLYVTVSTLFLFQKEFGNSKLVFGGRCLDKRLRRQKGVLMGSSCGERVSNGEVEVTFEEKCLHGIDNVFE